MVKHKLIDLNMSQMELAKRIGCKQEYVSKILSGKKAGIKYRKKIIEELDLVG